MNPFEKLKLLGTVTAFRGDEPDLQATIDQFDSIGAKYFVMVPNDVKLGKNAIIFEG